MNRVRPHKCSQAGSEFNAQMSSEHENKAKLTTDGRKNSVTSTGSGTSTCTTSTCPCTVPVRPMHAGIQARRDLSCPAYAQHTIGPFATASGWRSPCAAKRQCRCEQWSKWRPRYCGLRVCIVSCNGVESCSRYNRRNLWLVRQQPWPFAPKVGLQPKCRVAA